MGTDRNHVHPQTREILTYQPIFPQSQRHKLTWPLVVDEGMGELVGLLLHHSKVSHDEGFMLLRYTAYWEFLDRVEALLGRLGVVVSYSGVKWTGLFRSNKPSIHSVEFVHTFLDLIDTDRLELRMGVERVPKVIRRSPLTVQRAFVAGYLRGCPVKKVEVDGTPWLRYDPPLATIIPDVCRILTHCHIDVIPATGYFLTDLGLDLTTGRPKNETRPVKIQRKPIRESNR